MKDVIEIINHFIVNTRKPHNCVGCGRNFEKGTTMEKYDFKDHEDNSMYTRYLCNTCQYIISELLPDGGEYSEGEFAKSATHYEKYGEVVNLS